MTRWRLWLKRLIELIRPIEPEDTWQRTFDSLQRDEMFGDEPTLPSTIPPPKVTP